MTDTMTPEHPQPGHETRAEGAPLAVAPRLPLPPEREERARQAGHRYAALPHGYLRERMLLARTRRGN